MSEYPGSDNPDLYPDNAPEVFEHEAELSQVHSDFEVIKEIALKSESPVQWHYEDIARFDPSKLHDTFVRTGQPLCAINFNGTLFIEFSHDFEGAMSYDSIVSQRHTQTFMYWIDPTDPHEHLPHTSLPSLTHAAQNPRSANGIHYVANYLSDHQDRLVSILSQDELRAAKPDKATTLYRDFWHKGSYVNPKYL